MKSDYGGEGDNSPQLGDTTLGSGTNDERFASALGIARGKKAKTETVANLAEQLRSEDRYLVQVASWALERLDDQEAAREALPEILEALRRAQWFDVEKSERRGTERVDGRPTILASLDALLPRLKDRELDDFRRRFFQYAFDPSSADRPKRAAELANHKWYLGRQKRRFKAGENSDAPALDDLLLEAQQKFERRLVKNPTLGMEAGEYLLLPGFVRNHAASIAYSIKRSKWRAAARDRRRPTETKARNPELVRTVSLDLEEFIESALPEDERFVARIRLIARCSLRVTAKILGVSVSKVRTLESRVRGKAEKHFGGDPA